jgi:hypothetical protein
MLGALTYGVGPLTSCRVPPERPCHGSIYRQPGKLQLSVPPFRGVRRGPFSLGHAVP